MLFVILLVIFAALLIFGIYKLKRYKGYDKDGWKVLIGISIGAIVTLLLVPVCMSIDLQKDVAELEAFHDANSANYITAIELTEDLLSDPAITDGFLVDGSLEKMEQGQAVSARIAEWRNAINNYNSDLREMEKMKGNFWVGLVYPSLPERLEVLQVK